MSHINNDWLKEDLNDLLSAGKINRAIRLSKSLSAVIGSPIYFSHHAIPHYPTANLDAKTVFVHLNPGASLGDTSTPETFFNQCWNKRAFCEERKIIQELDISDFTKIYTKEWADYAYNRFVRNKEFDNFDYKQACFLLHWKNSGIELKQGDLSDKTIQQFNSVNVLNQKLQLELFPYGSNSIDTNKIVQAFELEPSIIAPYVENLLDTIALHPRTYVLFGSRIFSSLFKIYHQKVKPIIEIEEVEQKFTGITKNSLAFSFIQLKWNNQPIHAGIAHSFPRRDLPNAYSRMAEYGEKSWLHFMSQL